MSDFYGNYYVIAPNFPVTTVIQNTKLNPEFVLPYRTDEQMTMNSHWKPWTMKERFDRFYIKNRSALDGQIGQSRKNDSLEIRSLMIDIARNFYSLETLKVNDLYGKLHLTKG